MREYPERPLVGVGVILIKDHKILLVKRGHEPNKGMWSIPGGLIKLGETAEDAAVRETMEETGLKITLGQIVGIFNVVARDEEGRVKYHYVIIDYLGEVVGGTLTAGTDVTDVKWFRLEELDEIQTSPSVRKPIDMLFKSKVMRSFL
ncbi:MAG: NUDIX hydrolase [Candidatus Methanomethylicaceae archaeon]